MKRNKIDNHQFNTKDRKAIRNAGNEWSNQWIILL
jgi:hypothetical protein